jgi:hypothetical protein
MNKNDRARNNVTETAKIGPLSTLFEIGLSLGSPSCRRHCLVVLEGRLIRFTIIIERK